ncbi:MAG TPA: diguanylate cyclase [Pyrinomonadaceae bacterium]
MIADEKDDLTLESLAGKHGVAVVVLDENSREVAAANNNSICSQFYDSPDFGPKCAEDCGKAFARAYAAGDAVDYECHAGLVCRAVPIKQGGKPYVAIVGRSFISSGNYRNATEKAIDGDWQRFPRQQLFDNVILTGSSVPIEQVGRDLGAAAKPLVQDEPKPAKKTKAKTPPPPPVEEPQPTAQDTTVPDPFETSLLNYKLPAEEEVPPAADRAQVGDDQTLADREAWRAFIPTLLKVSYRLACRRILEFLDRHYSIESSLWLQRDGQQFEMAAVLGELEDKPVRIEIPVDDKRIRAAVRDDSPIVLREVQTPANKKPRVIQLFPVVIGGEVRNALGIAREDINPEFAARILNFCRYVASRLEILRLRDAVAQQERISRVLKDFNDQLRNIDQENFWQELTRITARLVDAERASLLVLGPAESFTAKAAVGSPVDISGMPDLGSRVARTILEKGKPALVADVKKASLSSVEAERMYRTSSFISYPLVLGGSGIGVLNFTDKAGGERFDKHDLEVLDSVAPQIAVALDRIALRDKVGEFAQLSVTDPLTGLLNRRYLQERLSEEINRSDRSGEPLSFLMLDVDEFKSYNDRFGHPAGDEALRIVGSILHQNLRGADVAVRYGGEEFSVLLPATSIDEAEAIAQRIRMHVERTDFPRRKVTVSIGAAGLAPEIATVGRLINAADQALLRAKNMGRNNVQIYDPILDGGEGFH